jgi:hypothetical protein
MIRRIAELQRQRGAAIALEGVPANESWKLLQPLQQTLTTVTVRSCDLGADNEVDAGSITLCSNLPLPKKKICSRPRSHHGRAASNLIFFAVAMVMTPTSSARRFLIFTPTRLATCTLSHATGRALRSCFQWPRLGCWRIRRPLQSSRSWLTPTASTCLFDTTKDTAPSPPRRLRRHLHFHACSSRSKRSSHPFWFGNDNTMWATPTSNEWEKMHGFCV